MGSSLDALALLAEITAAFVAFAVIVASIRVTFGTKLEPFQLLLVHFFTESGMLTVTFPLVAIVLYQFFPDESVVATLTNWYAFLMIFAYLLFYLRRRRKVSSSVPFLSMLNIILWVIWVIVLGIALTNYFWQPSLALISALTFWGLFSATVIFISFLSTFLTVDDSDNGHHKTNESKL
jgi:hypothetical protein